MAEPGGKARRQPPGNDTTDWLTLGQAARYLGVAQSTIRKWSDQGRLSAFYTPGGHRRYRRRDLDSFVAASGSGAGSRVRGTPMVLIVDDDARIREFVRVNLEMDGYQVREAGNAEEGLAVLDDEPPDLILLDVMMPGMDGWEMLRRVQERHGNDSIPVIMFSGQADNSQDDAVARGAQGFVGKPFNPQELISRTKELLRS
ncbi:MAG: response regulator [Actinomycetota bacterium]|nr:response regulator [Actinomycetota bacterium]